MIKITFTIMVVSVTLGMSSIGQADTSKWLKAKSDENMSMIQYAEENHERLSKAAVSFRVDPDFSSWAALWSYKMPDGSVVNCTRGMLGNTFMYKCS